MTAVGKSCAASCCLMRWRQRMSGTTSLDFPQNWNKIESRTQRCRGCPRCSRKWTILRLPPASYYLSYLLYLHLSFQSFWWCTSGKEEYFWVRWLWQTISLQFGEAEARTQEEMSGLHRKESKWTKKAGKAMTKVLKSSYTEWHIDVTNIKEIWS
jgi:hypothetical protein